MEVTLSLVGLAERVLETVEQILQDFLHEMLADGRRVMGYMLSNVGVEGFGEEVDSCLSVVRDRPDREQVQNHAVV